MNELGGPTAVSAGVVAIVLLIVLLAEHELLRVADREILRKRKRFIAVAVVPLLVACGIVVVARLIDIASVR